MLLACAFESRRFARERLVRLSGSERRNKTPVRRISPQRITRRQPVIRPSRDYATDHLSLITDHFFLLLNFYFLLPVPLVRRHRRPRADAERSEHDFHCKGAKDESHYTDEDGRALPTDHPQNRIRKKQQDVGEVEYQKAETYVGACVLS